MIGDHTRRALWILDCKKLEKLLFSVGLDLRTLACHRMLDAMRLVVNVFKHGGGRSLDDLRQLYPEFLGESAHRWGFYDDTDMEVSDKHVEDFAAAIESFWRDLPSFVMFDEDAALDVPDEFEKAWKKDLATRQTS